MQLLTHEDPNVRYEALLCVQKLMVQNWYSFINYLFSYLCFKLRLKCFSIKIFREYLGKQLEKETGGKNKEISAKA